jgi:hypothetical protein
MSHDEALTLQAAIDTILAAAAHEPGHVRSAMGAINWGDLRCVDLEERRSLLHPGEPQIVAIIEEASPDAIGLHAYIHARLCRDDVTIETEW